MTISVRQAGVWNLGDPRANISEIWKESSDGFVNVDGVWVPFYSRTIKPGDAFQGGFLIGVMSYADGNDYYLIDAGAEADGVFEWTTDPSLLPGNDLLDGWGNCTSLFSIADYPAIQWARAYQGGGFDDWYLPSYYEGEFRYRTMKPVVSNNEIVSTIQNPSSVPPGPVWTTSVPGQTTISAYQLGGAQALQGSISVPTRYWTSSATGSEGGAYGIQTGSGVFQAFPPVAPTGYISRPVRKVLVSSVPV